MFVLALVTLVVAVVWTAFVAISNYRVRRSKADPTASILEQSRTITERNNISAGNLDTVFLIWILAGVMVLAWVVD